ncbi:hypothetical protein AB0K57_10420 [Streptomyces halstedii]|uniref:hypothetical protein n=1 Tax=Streptomyces TaxID=1883 RepID=UPI0009985C70|nr:MULTISPECIES: hypothetical protein [unclassified Streptomyces]MYR72501.1 hypothetical protein [Streptomyces sp. SID4925]
MISHTGALFNDGPVRRVVETALRAQQSQGALDLGDELRRFGPVCGRPSALRCTASDAAR